MDDFDSYYHFDLTRYLLKEIINSNVQAMIILHDTSLIDNNLLRPDCYFNLKNGYITSFADLTKKELRKAHNLEKMYRAGSFND